MGGFAFVTTWMLSDSPVGSTFAKDQLIGSRRFTSHAVTSQ